MNTVPTQISYKQYEEARARYIYTLIHSAGWKQEDAEAEWDRVWNESEDSEI